MKHIVAVLQLKDEPGVSQYILAYLTLPHIPKAIWLIWSALGFLEPRDDAFGAIRTLVTLVWQLFCRLRCATMARRLSLLSQQPSVESLCEESDKRVNFAKVAAVAYRDEFVLVSRKGRECRV